MVLLRPQGHTLIIATVNLSNLVLTSVFPLEEIGAGHVTGKVSFYRSNWKKIGRILSVFIALKRIDRQAI